MFRRRFKIVDRDGERRAPRKPLRAPLLHRGHAPYVAIALLLGCAALIASPFVFPTPDTRSATEQLTALERPRVIDGDTVEDMATGERFRIANIDTAETQDRARCAAERRHGERAKAALRRILAQARDLDLRRVGEDRYGRTLAVVIVDGRDLGRLLIEQGLARPWRGAREPWCGRNGELLS